MTDPTAKERAHKIMLDGLAERIGAELHIIEAWEGVIAEEITKAEIATEARVREECAGIVKAFGVACGDCADCCVNPIIDEIRKGGR